MDLTVQNGLLTTTMTIFFQNKSLTVDEIIIDTGSTHTMISADVVSDIDITYQNNDPIYEAYGIGGSAYFFTKTMDEIHIGSYVWTHHPIDIGTLPPRHNGLIGLDLLMKQPLMIDFQKQILHSSMKNTSM
ncbi:Aspartyl protease [Alteribacillus persepolensis]|uniref:Aspartyl protease n=1 Tax=Alteribacillus persepolensis TaxID=568899 RepID=A0A1G8C1P6_9BACI|nr:retropepsin-like aspartic protease [Alteribacillus persepolensis]SDH39294.1 Aspartyl protease [Alteribacillus persepolensis]